MSQASDCRPIPELFRHCPACGAPASEPAIGDRFVCVACDFCYHFNAATSVGALLRRADGHVLFLKRGREPAKGKLCFPGGFVDPGEGAEEALRREIREEVGLEVHQLHYFASFANKYCFRHVEYDTTDLFFTADLPSHQPIVPHEREVASTLFLSPSDQALPDQLAYPSLRQALQAYRNIQAV